MKALYVIYFLVFVNCFINAFARHSRGALFEDKARWQALHSIVFLVLVILGVVKYGWIQILWIFLIDFVAYIPIVSILRNTILKR